MAETLQCYRCGSSLAALSLPLSRQDQCPECSHYLHVCRMCRDYDPRVPKQCREDDAEEVTDKEKPNFCDWFVPAEQRFDDAAAAERARAEQRLDSLFGEAPAEQGDEDDALTRAARDLFR